MDAIERRRSASEEAAQWWLELQTDMPLLKREQFVDWLCESPLNVSEMLHAARVHGALDSFERWARITVGDAGGDASVVPFPLKPEGMAGSARPDTIVRSHRWLVMIAASVCAIALATAWLVGTFNGQAIVTERGERREITLADGSVLQLGPQTRLQVYLDEDERRIVFDHGVTLFRVAKDPARPFVVQAERTVVRAVGTSFGVERRDRGVIVTVAEGRVAITEAPQWTLPFLANEPPSPRDVALDAGQQVAVMPAGEISAVRAVDEERELAWTSGRLVFENQPLLQVIEEFNRYNRIQLHVTDGALARRPISAVFNASEPESLIAFIESVASVRIIRKDGESITISGRGDAATENSH